MRLIHVDFRESHVSRLEKRLRSLEGKFVGSNITPASPGQGPSPGSQRGESSIEIDISPESGEKELFEGETSFARQSSQVNEIVQRTVRSDTSGNGSKLDESVEHLQNLLQDNYSSANHSFKCSTVKPAPAVKPLPPALVISILRRFKGMLCSILLPVSSSYIGLFRSETNISFILCS